MPNYRWWKIQRITVGTMTYSFLKYIFFDFVGCICHKGLYLWWRHKGWKSVLLFCIEIPCKPALENRGCLSFACLVDELRPTTTSSCIAKATLLEEVQRGGGWGTRLSPPACPPPAFLTTSTASMTSGEPFFYFAIRRHKSQIRRCGVMLRPHVR